MSDDEGPICASKLVCDDGVPQHDSHKTMKRSAGLVNNHIFLVESGELGRQLLEPVVVAQDAICCTLKSAACSQFSRAVILADCDARAGLQHQRSRWTCYPCLASSQLSIQAD